MVQDETQVVAYVRVSSVDQNLGRQPEAVGDIDRVFEEKVSGGSRADRVGLLDCIRYVREGDVVKVASMDRLARSLGDLRDIVGEITGKGASLVFVKEQQTYSRDTDDAIGRLMLNLLGAFAEFERTLIRERQWEGIRLAQAAGKYKGRAQKFTAKQLVDARRLIQSDVPKAKEARDLQIDRTPCTARLLEVLRRRRQGSEAPHPFQGVERLVLRVWESGKEHEATLAVASWPRPAGPPSALHDALLRSGCLQSLEEPGVGIVSRGALGEGELRNKDLSGTTEHAFLARRDALVLFPAPDTPDNFAGFANVSADHLGLFVLEPP